MRRSFSYTLLITWIFISGTCKTPYVQTSTEMRNYIVTDSVFPTDSQLVSIYLPYKQKLDENITRVISKTREQMVKNKPESNLTNFLADLLLEEGKRTLQDIDRKIEPDLSFFNYGGIRTLLPKGEITVGKVFELMPFENEMVFLQLSGTQVQEFLDAIATKGGDSVGGVRFTIKGNKATGIKIGNKPLNSEEKYWMVTNDYVASGGDGMEVLTQRSEIITTNRKIRDVIISYMERKYKMGEDIYVKPDNRITYSQ